MKAAQLQTFDKPEKAVSCVELPDPPAPGPNQISADIEAFPINPADLHQCQGTYAVRPPLPALIGAESVGRITAIGNSVQGLTVGDRIIFLNRENWVEKRTVDAEVTVRLPEAFQGDISDDLICQAAMLKINPATALMLLLDFETPEPGDWIIHNAANSSVGIHIVGLAQRNGWKAINVVRSETAAKAMRDAGAQVVLLDTDNLPDEVAKIATSGRVRLGIDSIGGESSRRLANSLDDDATFVTFGRISGQPMQLDTRKFIYEGLTAKGFWLSNGLAKRTHPDVEAFYTSLATDIHTGKLHTAIEATYPIADIKQALVHAQQSQRSGKILVRPQST